MSELQGRFIESDPGDGPPDEAYSRVTNPERFAALHDMALAWIERLAREYAATAAPIDDTDIAPHPFERARPTVCVTPRDANAAPITFAFTAFPGLIVRFGHWSTIPFPSCGCDACGGSAKAEQKRLDDLIGHVLAGRFREEIKVPLLPLPAPFHPPTIGWTFGEVLSMAEVKRAMNGRMPIDPESMKFGGSGGGRAVERDEARRLIGRGPRSVAWAAWPRLRG